MEEGTPCSSVGRASDSRSRGPGFETGTRHLVVGSDLTEPALSEERCAGGDNTYQQVMTPNFLEWDIYSKQKNVICVSRLIRWNQRGLPREFSSLFNPTFYPCTVFHQLRPLPEGARSCCWRLPAIDCIVCYGTVGVMRGNSLVYTIKYRILRSSRQVVSARKN